MSERWLRWYDGTVRDGKMMLAAHISEEPVCTVVGVWAALLEDASTGTPRGTATRGLAYHSMWLGIADRIIGTVWNALERAGAVAVDGERITILSWSKRQFEIDAKDPTSKERKAKWRNKNKQLDEAERSGTERNGLERSGTPESESESESDTESEKIAGPIGPPDVRAELFGRGLQKLARMSGKTPDSCRSLLGRLLKAVDDEAIHVLAAIEDAERNRVADPVAWIMRALRPRTRERVNETDRERRKRESREALNKLEAFGEGGNDGNFSQAPVRLLPRTGTGGEP